MGVDDVCELDAGVGGFLKVWQDSALLYQKRQKLDVSTMVSGAHSGGFAGSTITACFVLSSVTR